MAKHIIYGFFGFLSVVVLAVALYAEKPAPVVVGEEEEDVVLAAEEQTAAVAGAETAAAYHEVVKVIDGDTIVVATSQGNETVRLIGIDAKETGECFSTEATKKLRELIGNKRVALEIDASQGERDRYDRLLAYVFREDGLHAGLELLERGFVYEYTYNKAYKYQTEFRAAESVAKNAARGLWAAGACAPAAKVQPAQTPAPAPAPKTTTPAPQTTPEAQTSPAPQQTQPAAQEEQPPPQQQSAPPPAPPPATPPPSQYSCSSNTYNCSDFSTHAEAQAVYEACGGVNNDVHRLDANKDGQACESLP